MLGEERLPSSSTSLFSSSSSSPSSRLPSPLRWRGCCVCRARVASSLLIFSGHHRPLLHGKLFNWSSDEQRARIFISSPCASYPRRESKEGLRDRPSGAGALPSRGEPLSRVGSNLGSALVPLRLQVWDKSQEQPQKQKQLCSGQLGVWSLG